MANRTSVLSRFRLAAAAVIVGVAVVGTLFYGLVNSHFLGAIISRTLGPYSDSLAEHGFASARSDTWQRMAAAHGVAIYLEPADGKPVAFDDRGNRIPGGELREGQVRATRIGPDGTRVTFYWTLWTFGDSHFPMLSGLLLMILAVVGSVFWLLQRQLRPLAWLHSGVEAVARGDFRERVPVVRNDEIGQVAAAFNEMTARVEEMIGDRERLLADVSHELRSPIARMKVALEFVPDGDKRDALVSDLREMENLISVLLEREELRSRAGRSPGNSVDVEALVFDVAAGFAERAPGVETQTPGPVWVRAESVLMRLVVQNLLDNAVKFSRPESAPVLVSLESNGEEIVLRVVDDGIGLPDGSEERVFEPFVKLDRARGHRVGYGLGLNLCQRIVRLHGGTIKLRGRSPRGAEARVVLPTHIAGSATDPEHPDRG